MKNNRLMYLISAILIIWNLILSGYVTSSKKEEENTIVNNYVINGFSTDLTGIVKTVKSSNVLVETEYSVLSGFAYRQDGKKLFVLTAGHGVNDASSIVITLLSGQKVAAELLNVDYYLDLALLQADVDVNINTVNFGDSSSISDGEFLLGIGTNEDSELALTSSLLMAASTNRVIDNSFTLNGQKYEYFLNTIQLSGLVNKGFSGSGVYNMSGELVGMITMSKDNTIFAITSNEIKYIVEKMINGDNLNRTSLGIKGQAVKDLEIYQRNYLGINLEVTNGFYVSLINPFSIGDKLGLKQGDVILTINDKTINKIDDILAYNYNLSDGDKFKVYRNGEKIELVYTISQEAVIND